MLLIQSATLYDRLDAGPFDVVVVDGRIAEIMPSGQVEFDGERFDAGGAILAPGLIDVHIHGAGGADAMEGSHDSLDTMAKMLAEQGTTGFLATVFVYPGEGDHLRIARAHRERTGGARLLGLHVEGPYLNVKRQGGIPAETIRKPTADDFDSIRSAAGDALRMMTIAPEIEGNDVVLRRLLDDGIVASLGHTDASYGQTCEAFDHGVRHVTHLYNAMRPMHHREPGPVPAILERDEVTVQLIADGTHIGDDMLAWTVRQLGLERCVLISDGMHGTGLPDGEYSFNGRSYQSNEGAARYTDGTLIGTTLGLMGVVQHFRQVTGCSLAEAVDCASVNPARVLRMDDRKGRIQVGADADLIVVDHNLRVISTFVAGRCVTPG
jgi:N-acetylglucosamine-6-phosphate deacetylase